MFELVDNLPKNAVIKVIGVGGGGGNAVKHMIANNIDGVEFICAGMEGALPTVLAGLIPQPIIGLPISVGYGISGGGKTALEGMLASCAPGLTVVNIDNGYGAAMAAMRILST